MLSPERLSYSAPFFTINSPIIYQWKKGRRGWKHFNFSFSGSFRFLTQKTWRMWLKKKKKKSKQTELDHFFFHSHRGAKKVRVAAVAVGQDWETDRLVETLGNEKIKKEEKKKKLWMKTLKGRDRGGDKSLDRKQGLILIEQNREKIVPRKNTLVLQRQKSIFPALILKARLGRYKTRWQYFMCAWTGPLYWCKVKDFSKLCMPSSAT